MGIRTLVLGVVAVWLGPMSMAQDNHLSLPGAEKTTSQQLRHGWDLVEARRPDQALATANMLLFEGPIRVYSESSAFDRRAERIDDLIQRAVSIWSRALGEPIPVQRVSDSRTAQVTARMMNEIRLKGRSVAGFTTWSRWSRPDDVGVRADVSLALQGAQGQGLSDEAMLHAALHEVGHVLGLDDGDPGGVMGLLNPLRPVTVPSKQEVQVLRTIRAQSRKLRDAARLWMGPG